MLRRWIAEQAIRRAGDLTTTSDVEPGTATDPGGQVLDLLCRFSAPRFGAEKRREVHARVRVLHLTRTPPVREFASGRRVSAPGRESLGGMCSSYRAPRLGQRGA